MFISLFLYLAVQLCPCRCCISAHVCTLVKGALTLSIASFTATVNQLCFSALMTCTLPCVFLPALCVQLLLFKCQSDCSLGVTVKPGSIPRTTLMCILPSITAWVHILHTTRYYCLHEYVAGISAHMCVRSLLV